MKALFDELSARTVGVRAINGVIAHKKNQEQMEREAHWEIKSIQRY